MKRLIALKKMPGYNWLNDVSSVALQQSIRNQQTAFSHFFAGRAKYPNFKRKTSRQSASFTKTAFKYRDGKITIAKSKDPLNIKWSRELPSEPSSITISKDAANRYFVSYLCEFESKSLPISNKTVGIYLVPILSQGALSSTHSDCQIKVQHLANGYSLIHLLQRISGI